MNFAMNKVQEAAYLVDENARFHYVNENAYRILGYTRDELLNLRVPDIDPDYPINRWTGHWKDLKKKGSLIFEARHKTKDGRIFPVEVNANYFECEGQAYNLALIRDITERKQNEQALREKEKVFFEGQKMFRTLVENSPDIIARYDRDCQRIYVNPKYLKVAGMPEPELLATSPIQYSPLPPSSALALQELIQRVLTSGMAETADIIWPKADNIDYWYNVYASPEFDREGNVTGVMTTSRDITQRKQTEEQILKLNRIYAVLSNINQAIIRIHETKELFDEACRIVIEHGKFRMARIGMINFRTNKVEIVASHGVSSDYLEKINPDLGDEERSKGPTGYKSIASFSLKVYDKVVGAINICSDETDFFHETDIKLLDEMAKDISFALEYMDSETKREQATLQHIESEQKFRSLAESSPDIIIRYDMNGKAVYVNHRLEERVNSVTSSIIGKTPMESVSTNPIGMEQYQTKLQYVIQSGQSGEVEINVPNLEGEFRTHHVLFVAERNNSGNIIGAIAIGRDITDRKILEEERLSHLKFLQSMEQVNGAILGANDINQMMTNTLETILSIFDCDRTWLFYPCDPDAPFFRVPMEITKPGYPGAGILNKDVPMPPDMARNLREALESVEPVVYLAGSDKPINKVSAGQFNVKSMMMVALYPRMGKPWVFGLHQCSYPRVWTKEEKKLFRDIGRRLTDSLTSLLVLRDLKESEERYRIIAENTADTIAVLDLNLNTVYVSPSVFKLRGYSVQEVLTQSLDQILTPGSLQKVRNIFAQQMELESTGISDPSRTVLLELEEVTKNGSVIWVELVASFLRDSQSIPTGILTVTRDITKRKRAEEEVYKLNQELEQRVAIRTAQLEAANKELEAFAYSVSHDLRAPLRAIDGFVGILNEDYGASLDPEAIHLLDVVTENAKKMGHLIDDLLTFSRMKLQVMITSPINMEQIVNDVLKEIAEAGTMTNYTINVHPIPGTTGDPALLKEVWKNLIWNAHKFSSRKQDPIIEIGHLISNDEVIYYIRDNGVGFDMQYYEQLFGVFQRLHSSKEFEGTGVGLALTQRIIERHHGRIWAEGKVNEGASFYFTIG